jgi:hypothetical protein
MGISRNGSYQEGSRHKGGVDPRPIEARYNDWTVAWPGPGCLERLRSMTLRKNGTAQ